MTSLYRVKRICSDGTALYGCSSTSRKEAVKRAEQKRADYERGIITKESNMPVKAWIEVYKETYLCNLKGKYADTTTNRIDANITAIIGNLRLKSVKASDCQKCINVQIEKGNSAYSVHETARLLYNIFDKAVADGLINRNPASNIAKGGGKKAQKRESLTAEEERAFLQAISKSSQPLYFLLMYGCGCRPSEAAEVKGSDILREVTAGQYESYFLHPDGKPILHIRGTKTKSADRYVPIPPETMKYIPSNKPFTLLCTTERGNAIRDEKRAKLWQSLIRLMNIEMGCKVYRNEVVPPFAVSDELVPYCLRHTYCSNLAKKGVDIRTAMYLMGHSDIRMTANIYTHIQTADVIAEAFRAVN